MKEKYAFYYKKLKSLQDSVENPDKEGSRKPKVQVCFGVLVKSWGYF